MKTPSNAYLTVALLTSLLIWSLPANAADTIPLKQKTGGTDEKSILDPSKSKGHHSVSTDDLADASSETQPKVFVGSVGTFGDPKLNEAKLRATLGDSLEKWISKGLAQSEDTDAEGKRLAKRIQQEFHLAFADWSIVESAENDEVRLDITLDVVREEDRAKRMNFLTEPTGRVDDPAGLIASWKKYEEVAYELMTEGKLVPDSEQPRSVTCRSFTCPFGHRLKPLESFGTLFQKEVAKNEAKLVEVLTSDSREEHRAAAVFLLGYMNDGKKLVSLMAKSSRDPSDLVRNNSLRMLGDIAEFNKQILIPIEPVLQALNYPRVTDRSKALYVLDQLVPNSKVAKEGVKTVASQLVDFMQSNQPDERELAHRILKNASGLNYKIAQTQDWRNWVSKVAKDRAPTQKR